MFTFAELKAFLPYLSQQKFPLTRSYILHKYLHTRKHTRSFSALHKHGRRHKAIAMVDSGALVIVLGVTVCAHVRRRDLIASRIIPTRGGSRVIMLPFLFIIILLIMVGIQVLPAAQTQHTSLSPFM